MKKTSNTKLIVSIGIFASVAFVLQVLGGMLPKVGGFLEMEISDLPPLILSFYYGPLVGVLTELIKNMLHLFMTTTGGVGEIANFVMNGTMCLVAGLIYKRIRTFKGAVISLGAGTLAMVFAGILANLFIMIPLYMPTAPFIQKYQIVMFTILPFNIVKGIIISLLTLLVYKKISRIISD